LNAAEQLLGAAALARHGHRPALVCGNQTLTFSELAARVCRSSVALGAFGVRPGDRVLFLLRDTPEFAAAWLGAVRAGAVAVALNNRLSEIEYRHILRDSAARLVIVEDVFALARPDLTAELARDHRLAIAGVAGTGMPDWRAAIRQANADSPAYEAEPGAPALALYSSGTTGRPKGMLHSHRSVACVGQSFRELGIGEGDRVFSTSKFFFAYGLEHGLLAPLALGATSILFADWPDAEAVLDIATRHRPSALFSVPTLYRRLLAEPRARLEPVRAVRRFVAGGERLSPQLVRQWREATGGEILNLYGMSETFCACVITPPGTSDGARTGLPLQGVQARLLDARGQDPGADASGVLWIRHPAQASGYMNLPEETRTQFKDGWFCTRDVFIRDPEGYLVHQGRSDELIKIAGQWVQPGEIEEAVGLVPEVLECACVPLEDSEGLERLALFLTVRGDSAATAQAAQNACERALPRHKRPKWIRVVSELPRTATGKVQRYRLRELLERELAAKD
jgi:3-hydroxybenzoate/4-hydroxybenzoate---CoA ligase